MDARSAKEAGLTERSGQQGDHPDDVAVEAARWLVALKEAPRDAALGARFAQWLAVDPRHGDAWDNTCATYEKLGLVPSALRDQWHAPPQRISARLSPRGRAGWVAMAALAAGLIVLLLPDLALRWQADQLTATGQTRDIQLSDGSRAVLGPDSALAFDDNGARRGVRLLRGRVFFDVVPDPGRPFRVRVGDTDVTVLGTAFEVALTSADTEVAVVHGLVRVERGALRQDLGAGDQAVAARGGGLIRKTVTPAGIASWRERRIDVRNRRIADVVADLRPWYGGKIILTGSKLGERRVSGSYNAADPLEALAALIGPHGGTMRRVTPWLVIVSDD